MVNSQKTKWQNLTCVLDADSALCWLGQLELLCWALVNSLNSALTHILSFVKMNLLSLLQSFTFDLAVKLLAVCLSRMLAG